MTTVKRLNERDTASFPGQPNRARALAPRDARLSLFLFLPPAKSISFRYFYIVATSRDRAVPASLYRGRGVTAQVCATVGAAERERVATIRRVA